MDTGKGSYAVSERQQAPRMPLRIAASQSAVPVQAVPTPPRAPVVLLGEHNRISQRLLRRVLLRLGYQVRIADNLDEAMQVFERNPKAFSLVVLDLKAPMEGGIDYLRRWPPAAADHAVPLIALGNDPSEETRRECLGAGADIYLPEALRDDRLSRAVEAANARYCQAVEVDHRPPVLDEKAFGSLLEMSADPAFIRELIEDFRNDAGGYFTRLQQALKKRSSYDWHEAMHALKGSAMGVGAMPLAKLCARHEDLSREALRAGRGFSEYEHVLEVFHRSVEAMQEMARIHHGGGSVAGSMPVALQAGA